MTIELSNASVSSFTGFIRLVQQTLIAAWGKGNVNLHAAYPKVKESEPIPTPIITYSYEKRPAKFGRETEIKPRLREQIEIQTEDGFRKVDILGQTFDYTVFFEIWADNGQEADETAERFQRFMTQYSGYFKKLGVGEILFELLDSDQTQNPWRSGLIRRTFQYHIRLDETVGIKDPVIENINVHEKLHADLFFLYLDLINREEDLG